MTDIERRLRDLGERVRDQQGQSALPPNAVRAAKRRRLGTAFTSFVVVAALAYGGTLVAGAFDTTSSVIPPASDDAYSADVPGEVWVVSEDGLKSPALNLAWGRDSEQAETLACVGVLPPGTSRVDLVHDESGDVLSWGENFVTEGDLATVCARNLEPELLVEVANHPSDYRLVIDGDLEVRLVRTETIPTSERTPDACGPPVDFEPTYLPEGWSRDLQRGTGAGGQGYPGLIGHFGGVRDAGVGYYDLVAGSSPLAQSNKREIEVLGGRATSGDIHEGLSVEFTHGGCLYALIAYVFDRAELERFAEGLRPKSDSETESSDEGSDFAAIWPEDIEERAGEECTSIQHVDGHWRSDPVRTAERFSTEVLGWGEAQATQSKREGGFVIYVGNGPISSDTPTVVVHVDELFGGCWSVISVSRLPEEQPKEDGSMSVRGRDVQMGFDLGDATSAVFEVGYGGQTTRYIWEGGDMGVEFRLDFEPEGTGHFLVLLRDANGEVFSAFGSPLPEGDFAAG